jgi:ubiquinone biosynthesis protein UbiJ
VPDDGLEGEKKMAEQFLTLMADLDQDSQERMAG